MRQIEIIPRRGHQVGVELHASILHLWNSAIAARNAAINRDSARIWVLGEDLSTAVDMLQKAGFHATALTETEVSN